VGSRFYFTMPIVAAESQISPQIVTPSSSEETTG
jgi:hypothetical protein